MTKKVLLTLGSISVGVIPVIGVVSCGGEIYKIPSADYFSLVKISASQSVDNKTHYYKIIYNGINDGGTSEKFEISKKYYEELKAKKYYKNKKGGE